MKPASRSSKLANGRELSERKQVDIKRLLASIERQLIQAALQGVQIDTHFSIGAVRICKSGDTFITHEPNGSFTIQITGNGGAYDTGYGL